jgi:ubiquinol-cytochrome c reductase cytochrome b subunit
VKAGLLMRRRTTGRPDVFIAAIVLHLLRVFFTGAYPQARELTYWIGLTILMVSLLEGFLGYSIVDDLLSGWGSRSPTGRSRCRSRSWAPNLSSLIWDGPFPGQARLLLAHVHRARVPVPGADRRCCSRCTSRWSR